MKVDEVAAGEVVYAGRGKLHDGEDETRGGWQMKVYRIPHRKLSRHRVRSCLTRAVDRPGQQKGHTAS